MLRTIPVLACLLFASSGFAQDETSVVVFLKSPYYAKVAEQSLTGAGAKNIDPSWCLPGADLAKFPWADEFALVARGNNPMPLVHAVMSDSDGKCTYFTVYTPMHAVPPDLGKKLAEWEPALSSMHKAQSSAVPEKPQTPSPVATGALPPPAAIAVMQSVQQGNGEEQAPLPRPKPPIIVARKSMTPPKPKEPRRSLAPAAAGTPRVPIAGSAQSP